MQAFEKLGAFYLGKVFDAARGGVTDELLLYDAKDLTTHAVCVGMTGSGKTGLCLSLLEEAAIDGIPALAIDPKGDLGNLLLTFPELRAADFRPWIDEAEAARKGQDPETYAASVAALWQKGLADWGQDGRRIAAFRDAAELSIYTPGSSAGLSLTLLRSFTAPPQPLREDADAFRERVMATVSGLLALLGLDADPIRSRDHILISTILQQAWEAGRDLDLATLIREIQSPPFDRVGVMNLDSFFPEKDRFGLAMQLNNLLASPGFASWMEGEPLDIQRLLWTREGRPRITILSIAHLSDAERMFFVTLLLNELVAWMRTQPGTPSLRALLYMDEVFGYFPPTANPPSKTPMLTLLKQARAYGLGVVLATQNPVDLDYKGLSNAGTWFLGRLQTERDKARVLEGLEGASLSAGARFDRGRMESTLAGLGSRVFLINNVHEDQPVLFHTRWALSYLRGPLTRAQIQTLMAPQRAAASAAAGVAASATPAAVAASVAAAPSPAAPASSAAASERPVLPSAIEELFAERDPAAPGGRPYRPALLGTARVHFVKVSEKVDAWQKVSLLAPLCEETLHAVWSEAVECPDGKPVLDKSCPEGAVFAALPQPATQPKSYRGWERDLIDHLYRSRRLSLWKCRELKQVGRVGEEEGDFRARLTQMAREERDRRVARLEKRYAPKLATIQDRIRRAEERVDRERSQYGQQKMQTAISVGATVLGALFGRKITSVGNVGRATTAMRGAGRAARERQDIERASKELEAQRDKLADLERDLQQDLRAVREAHDPAALELEQVEIRPRKSDTSVERVALIWVT